MHFKKVNCLVKVRDNHLPIKAMLKQLIKVSPHLENANINTKRYRRGDTRYTIFMLKVVHKREFLEACKKLKFEIMKDQPSRNRRIKVNKTIDSCKLCSLNINHLLNKKEQLDILLQVEKPTVLCLQETWKKSTLPPVFRKYMLTMSPSIGKNKPGLMTLVRKGGAVRCSKKGEDSNILQTIVEFKTSSGWIKLLVVNVYIPQDPILKQDVLAKMINLLNLEKMKKCYKEIIVMGDMNISSKSFKKKLSLGGLDPFIEYNRMSGTRILSNGEISKKRIDTIFRVSTQDNEIITISKQWSISDHLLLRRKIVLPTPLKEVRYTYDRRKLELPRVERALERALRNKNLSLKDLPSTLEQVCCKLKIYKKQKARRGLPMKWSFLNAARKARRATEVVLNRWSIPNAIKYLESKLALLKEKFKLRKVRANAWAFRGIKLYKSNTSREFWRWLKGRSCSSVRLDQVHLKDENGIAFGDSEKKLEIANKFYAELASAEKSIGDTYKKSQVQGDVDEITFSELWDATRSCGNNKAAGPDSIPTELYKILLKPRQEEKKLQPFLVNELNKIIKGESPPESWSTANLVCLHKKGDQSDLNNYRGISLINTISKIYLKIINDRLTRFVEESNAISPFQAGFRKGEECMNQVASLLEVVKRREFQSYETYMCFIDFEKAYDNVSHRLMFEKLQKIGVQEYLINALKDIYLNTKMKVIIDNDTSCGYNYRKGLRQGCPCSPMLFNIFINDIFNDIEGLTIPRSNIRIPGLMFADDIVIFGNTRNDLASKVEKVAHWATKNQVKINCNKSGVLVWNTSIEERDPCDLLTTFGLIREVQEYKYLGVKICRHTLEEDLVTNAASRGVKALEVLKPKLLSNSICIPFKGILLKSVLVPVLMYGSELWGMSSTRSSRINRVLRKGVRLIFRTTTVSLNRILDEFDIKRIHIQAALSRFRALKKWKHNKTIISELIKEVPRNRRTTWSTRTRRWLKR